MLEVPMRWRGMRRWDVVSGCARGDERAGLIGGSTGRPRTVSAGWEARVLRRTDCARRALGPRMLDEKPVIPVMPYAVLTIDAVGLWIG